MIERQIVVSCLTLNGTQLTPSSHLLLLSLFPIFIPSFYLLLFQALAGYPRWFSDIQKSENSEPQS